MRYVSYSRWLSVAGFNLMLLWCVGCSNTSVSVTVEVPKEKVQEDVSKKFPLQAGEEDKDSPLAITLTEPEVLFEEGRDQIGLRVHVLAKLTGGKPPADAPQLPVPTPTNEPPSVPSLPGPDKGPPGLPKLPPPPGGGAACDPDSCQPPNLPLPTDGPAPPANGQPPEFSGVATCFLTITYNSDDQSIKLSDPKITELEIKDLPSELTEPLKKIAEEKIGEKLAETSLPLPSESLEDKAVKTFMKSVTVKNGKLLVEIGW